MQAQFVFKSYCDLTNGDGARTAHRMRKMAIQQSLRRESCKQLKAKMFLRKSNCNVSFNIRQSILAMDMQTLTQMTLAFELAEQGLSHTKIAVYY